jgi:hypothetical protein
MPSRLATNSPGRHSRLRGFALVEPANSIAFKEWAVICAALGAGRQTLILRKGGIHEGREGFRVQHREFWLFPTFEHQAPESVVPEAAGLLEQTLAHQPADGTISLEHYAVVQQVFELADEATLSRLTGLHVWASAIVRDRFYYRQPGLFLLLVRVYKTPSPVQLSDSPSLGGCRSWVELDRAVSTRQLLPVMDDSEFGRHAQTIQAAVLGQQAGCE